MEKDLKDKIGDFFDAASSVIVSLGRKRHRVDNAEVVFVDNVNGRVKHNRTFTFLEMLNAFEQGSKPIGLILLDEERPEKMEAKEFSNLNQEELEALMHAFAEAQDQAEEICDDDGDEKSSK